MTDTNRRIFEDLVGNTLTATLDADTCTVRFDFNNTSTVLLTMVQAKSLTVGITLALEAWRDQIGTE